MLVPDTVTENTLLTMRIGQLIVTCCHCRPICPMPPSRNWPPVSVAELLAVLMPPTAITADVAVAACPTPADGVRKRVSVAAPDAAHPESKRMPETVIGPVSLASPTTLMEQELCSMRTEPLTVTSRHCRPMSPVPPSRN